MSNRIIEKDYISKCDLTAKNFIIVDISYSPLHWMLGV
jgi:hypothetical protein